MYGGHLYFFYPNKDLTPQGLSMCELKERWGTSPHCPLNEQKPKCLELLGTQCCVDDLIDVVGTLSAI